MVSTKKQSAQAEECGVSKLSALKDEYRQLWEQMAELDQEWIRKHEKLDENILAFIERCRESKVIPLGNGVNTNEHEAVIDSLPQELVKRTIDYYEVDVVDEDKEAEN